MVRLGLTMGGDEGEPHDAGGAATRTNGSLKG